MLTADVKHMDSSLLWMLSEPIKLQSDILKVVSVAQWLEEPPTDRKVVGSRLTEIDIGSRQKGYPK